MKTKLNLFLSAFLFVFTFLGFNQQASASHTIGSEITYKCTATPGIYEVTLVIYRRCDGGMATLCTSTCGASCSRTMSVQGADPSCSATTFSTFQVDLVSVRDADMKPHMPITKNACNNMTCVIPGTYTPAVERYEFKGLANLGPTSGIPASCCNIRLSWSYCCRNSNIRTGSAGAAIYNDAIINRCLSASPCNSSPVFYDDPFVDICWEQPYIHNTGAFDTDDDSLSFGFAPAYDSYNTSVPYTLPFTFDKPMPWSGSATAPYPQGIHCDPISGDISFNAPVGVPGFFDGLIAMEVKQWKKINGIPTVIGVTRRDMELTLRGDCVPNKAPSFSTIPFDTTNHDTVKTRWEVCAGKQLCFTINAKDSDFSPPSVSDTTYLTWDSTLAPYGATFLPTYTIANRKTAGPREDNYQFCWTPTQAMARNNPYLFTITAMDNRTPSPARQRRGFLIKVISQPDITLTKTDKQCGKWQVGYTNNKPNQTVIASAIRVAKDPFDVSFTGGSTVVNNTMSSPVLYFIKNGTYYIKLDVLVGNCITTFYDSLIVNNPFWVNVNDTLVCAGTATTLTATANNGTPTYSYRWFNNMADTSSSPLNANTAVPTFTITPNSTQSYIVQVRDLNGCRAYDSTIVQIKNNIKQVTVKPPKCKGANTGSILVNDSVPASLFQYKLDNGAFSSTNLFDSLAAGTYTITVKDSENCSTGTQISITQPSLLKDTLTTITPQSCIGLFNGSITTLAKGGISPYRYSIDSIVFDTTHVFNNLAPGLYTIHLRDSNQCYASFTKTVLPADSLKHTTTVKPIACFGNATGEVKISATGGKKPYTFQRDTAAFVPDSIFKNLAAGVYTFTIKDTNGCTRSFTDTVKSATALQQNTLSVHNTCFGANAGSIQILAGGGTPPYTYRNPQTTVYDTVSRFNNLNAGTYSLTIKDSLNCQLTFSKTITQPPVIVPVATTQSTTCFENADGKLTASATGGTAPYTYSIDSGSFGTTVLFTQLSAGNHTLIVRDSLMCQKGIIGVIVKPTLLKDTLTTVSAETCVGLLNGKITVLAKGGTKPYRYSIDSIVFDTTHVLSNLVPGVYKIHVRDSNQCYTSFTKTILAADSLKHTTTVTPIACFGNTTGEVKISATGGKKPYSFQRDMAAFVPDSVFKNLAAGVYAFAIKDANGCTRSFTDTVKSATALQQNTITIHNTCFGANAGSIQILATGGTPPYTYKNPQTTVYDTVSKFNNLLAGTYSLAIKDNHNCLLSFSKVVQQPTTVSFSAASQMTTCYEKNDGKITVGASGGTPPYTYSIDSGSFGSVTTFTQLAPGNHTVIARDSMQCERVIVISVGQPVKINATVSAQNISCFNKADGKITVTPIIGKSPFTYSLNGGTYTAANIFTNLSAGSYLVGMKDSMGCSDTAHVTLTAPPTISAGTISGPTSSLVNVTDTFSITPQPGLNILWATQKGTIVGGQTASTMYVRWDSVGTGIVGAAVYQDTTCGDTASMNVTIGSVGLTELANHWGLRVYPNPANNHLNIQLQQLPESTTIQLYDVQGKLVIQQELKLTQQLNIESLTPGMYLLKIGAWSGQVVKE